MKVKIRNECQINNNIASDTTLTLKLKIIITNKTNKIGSRDKQNHKTANLLYPLRLFSIGFGEVNHENNNANHDNNDKIKSINSGKNKKLSIR
ncbi:MAG: hypothetical protein LBU14_00300 [Candidatus Peribacteria bacterium]|jgi:hypothetical protein|nr:hypothetical protein [Candidatus Peribacteria bacterium]